MNSAKTHRLNILRDRAEALTPRLQGIWPRTNKFERQGFDLIRRAYVEARYSPHYQISELQLDWLSDRVSALLAAVEDVAAERLALLKTAAA